MAEAARRLAVSQPVVSRAIADLELALGIRLLDRTPQGVEPTVYGRTLLIRGLAVFDELRGSVKDIRFMTDPTAGELRIRSTQAIAAGLLVEILDRVICPQMPTNVYFGCGAKCQGRLGRSQIAGACTFSSRHSPGNGAPVRLAGRHRSHLDWTISEIVL